MKPFSNLKSDLEAAGWTTGPTPVEIGSRGYVAKRNYTTISGLTKKLSKPIKYKKLITELSKISLLCSFSSSFPSCTLEAYKLHCSLLDTLQIEAA